MRQGFRVIDSDTHVNPSFDVLLRYADQDLRDQMDDLKPYMRTVKPRPGQGDAEDHGLLHDTLGQASPSAACGWRKTCSSQGAERRPRLSIWAHADGDA